MCVCVCVCVRVRTCVVLVRAYEDGNISNTLFPALRVFGTALLIWQISSLVDPRSRQFPAVLLLNINICLCASSIGWIWTYSEGDDIICYEDGTLRFDAPR